MPKCVSQLEMTFGWFIGIAKCFSMTRSCVCIRVHGVCVCVCVCVGVCCVDPFNHPLHLECTSVLMSCGVCMSVCVHSLFLCNTFRGPFWSGQHLSPAPIRPSLLTLSFTLERERRSEKKREKVGWGVQWK